MNTRLLQRIAKHILAKPDEFQMPLWAEPINDARTGEICGSACCIAGDALLMNGAKLDNAFHFRPTAKLTAKLKGVKDACIPDGFPRRIVAPLTAGAALLGIETSPNDFMGGSSEASRLFLLDRWPEKFRVAYANAATDKGRARAGYNRIQHFIKTDGRE